MLRLHKFLLHIVSGVGAQVKMHMVHLLISYKSISLRATYLQVVSISLYILYVKWLQTGQPK